MDDLDEIELPLAIEDSKQFSHPSFASEPRSFGKVPKHLSRDEPELHFDKSMPSHAFIQARNNAPSRWNDFRMPRYVSKADRYRTQTSRLQLSMSLANNQVQNNAPVFSNKVPLFGSKVKKL